MLPHAVRGGVALNLTENRRRPLAEIFVNFFLNIFAQAKSHFCAAQLNLPTLRLTEGVNPRDLLTVCP